MRLPELVRFSRPASGLLPPPTPAGASGRRRRPAPPGFLLGAPETPPLGPALLPLGQLRFSTADSARDREAGPRGAGGAAPPREGREPRPCVTLQNEDEHWEGGLRLPLSSRSVPAAKALPGRGRSPSHSRRPGASPTLHSPRPAEPALM